MSSSQALASLTATYTDSENEEDINEEDDEEYSAEEAPAPPPPEPSPKEQPKSTTHTNSTSSSPILPNTRVPKLVSYHDDTVVSDNDSDQFDEDDEEDQAMRRRHAVEIIEPESHQSSPEPEPPTPDGIQLPPPPKKKCPADLQEKITRLYERMQNGIDMNGIIQKRKDFRNPSIYEKLIQFCGIKELGTNYPAEIYDPLKWGKESYFEELAKVQKTDMEAREKERKEKTKIEFVSGTKKLDDDAKRRKSKWDQPASNASGPATALKPAGLVQAPTLTTSATGTKGTVISAFGSLPKKPRL